MRDGDNIIQDGPFKGKKIALASTTGVDLFEAIVEDFMSRIFGFERGDYLITDESSLADFTGVDDMQLADIHRRIRDAYGLDVSDVESGRLLDIFVRIHEAA